MQLWNLSIIFVAKIRQLLKNSKFQGKKINLKNINPNIMVEELINAEVLKGGEFIVKEATPDTTFIPEELTEEQQMVRQMVRDFAANVGDRGGKLDKQVELLDEAAELGLLGSHIPEEYGGMPMDTNTNSVISEELGHIGGGFTTSYAAHIGIGTLPILYFGTEAQKQKYLPGLANGELKASYCLTEPSSGSDALAAKTTAELSADGKHWILNGQKMWISNAGFADVFIVFAKIDGMHFTCFIVEKGTSGLSLGAEEHKLGIKGSSTRQVFLENVKIPLDNLLGEKGKGHLIAFNILNVGRYKLGIMSVGGSKRAIDVGVKYANERVQFKTPISSFGAIQYKLAEMAIRTFTCESACYRTSDLMQNKKNALLAKGVSYKDSLLISAEEYAIECALIKVIGSETTAYCVDELVQIHGGYGFSEEYAAAGMFRDARINRIYEGTNEINRLLSVTQLLKKAMKGEIDLANPAWAVQKELKNGGNADMPLGKYAAEKKAVKDFKKLALMVGGMAGQRQIDRKINLKFEQEIVMNIADMLLDIYTAESTLVRVEKLSDMEEKPQSQELYEAILWTHLTDVQARMVKNATDALASFVEGDLLNTMLEGVRYFSKYPPVNVKNNRRAIATALINSNKYCF